MKKIKLTEKFINGEVHADTLIDTIINLEGEVERFKEIISNIEKAYRGNDEDLQLILDEYFYGGISPLKK